MTEKIRELCKSAMEGKISAKAFYDRLCALADDENTSGDLECILEDGIMELEMTGAADSGSGKRVIKDVASTILDELR